MSSPHSLGVGSTQGGRSSVTGLPSLRSYGVNCWSAVLSHAMHSTGRRRCHYYIACEGKRVITMRIASVSFDHHSTGASIRIAQWMSLSNATRTPAAFLSPNTSACERSGFSKSGVCSTVRGGIALTEPALENEITPLSAGTFASRLASTGVVQYFCQFTDIPPSMSLKTPG